MTDVPRIGTALVSSPLEQLGNANACVGLMHNLSLELDAQVNAPLGSFPLSLATLVLNTDGTVSTAWSRTVDLKGLHHLMWACETLRQRLATAIDEMLAAQEEDASPAPSDTPRHEQEPAQRTDQ